MRNIRKSDLIALTALLVITLFLWIPFDLRTIIGLHEEYSFILTGVDAIQENPFAWFSGYWRTRPLIWLPFIIAGLLPGNDFIWLTVMTMGITFLKGAALFGVIRVVLPKQSALAFIAGLLFIFYPADGQLFTFRALHINGSVAFGWAALFCVLYFWNNPRQRWVWGVLWVCQFLAITLYEVMIPSLVLAPILLFILAKKINLRLIVVTVLWWIIPVVAALNVVINIFFSGSGAYVNTVVRRVEGQNSLGTFLSSLATMYADHITAWATLQMPMGYGSFATLIVTIIIALVVFWLLNREAGNTPVPMKATALMIGLALASMSVAFVMYLPTSLRSLITPWRVYYATSAGAALALTTVLFLIRRIPRIGTWLLMIPLIGFISVGHLNAQSQIAFLEKSSQTIFQFLGPMVEVVPALRTGPPRINVLILDESDTLSNEWTGGAYFLHTATMLLRYVYGNYNFTAYVCVPGLQGDPLRPHINYCTFTNEGIALNGWHDDTLPYENLLMLRYRLNNTVEIVRNLPDYYLSEQFDGLPPVYRPDEQIRVGPLVPTYASFFPCLPVDQCIPTPSQVIAPKATVRYEFDGTAPPGIGWSFRDLQFSNSWMQSNIATIETRLIPGASYTIRIRSNDRVSDTALETLSLRVGGFTVPLNEISRDGNVAILEGIIPSIAIIDAPLTLIFETQEILPASTRSWAADSRIFGVRFDWVQLTRNDPTP